MYVSGEVITIAISAVGLLCALAGGFAWTIQRMDRAVREVREELKASHAGLAAEISGVRQELGEVKVGVARLEGRLERRLILPG
ncbi:hypothetical protein MWU75_02605 [Ornithinimicrobium sp. F0845]|uniref:hypothetical protein n=1 Tax=Ornithinimicrobium sp. F0845 TaxID=2926412 RepID=UPI001FF51328|nr:hypothetical protein [Ornithinimicrobium sp. F0845]MCK0111032.1 hypothetical protein [Ornithinimicrobium sp. F0845]